MSRNVDIDVSLIYNNTYCERILYPDKAIIVQVQIKNRRAEPLQIDAFYVALYNKSGNEMVSMTPLSSNESVAPGQTQIISGRVSFDGIDLNQHYAKVIM